MRTSVLHTALAVALVVGTACKGPDSLNTNLGSFAVVLRGANVVPAAADTTPSGTATVTGGATSITLKITITKGPATGTIDSIAMYQNAAGAALGTTATATFCVGTAACTTAIAGTPTATILGTNTAASLTTSMRAYGQQLVVFGTAFQKATGGVMRGTIYNLGS